jgi:large subunit ribosomal protein L4
LNKKLKSLARKSVLSAKTALGSVTVVEDFTFDKPTTKGYISFLSSFNLSGKKTVHILAGPDKNLYLSSRNLQKANMLSVDTLTTYHLVNAETLLISEQSVQRIGELFNN